MMVSLKDKVVIHPKDLNTPDLSAVILGYLRDAFETKISKYGYIFEDTIEVLSYGMGRVIPSYFNGSVEYEVAFKCKAFNPVPKSILEGKVISTSFYGLGVNVVVDDVTVANVTVIKNPDSRSLPNSEVNLDTVKINDTVLIELQQKFFQLGGQVMTGIARIVKSAAKEEKAKRAVKGVMSGGKSIAAAGVEEDPDAMSGSDEEDDYDEDESQDGSARETEADLEDEEFKPDVESVHDDEDEEEPDDEDLDNPIEADESSD